jgi:hypothetical protein
MRCQLPDQPCCHALVVELADGSAWSSGFEDKRFRRLSKSYLGCKRASVKAVRGKRWEIMQVQRRLTLAASMHSRFTIVPIKVYSCTPRGNDPRRLYRGVPVAVTLKPLWPIGIGLTELKSLTATKLTERH